MVGTSSMFEHLLKEQRAKKTGPRKFARSHLVGPAPPGLIDDVKEELGIPETTIDEDRLLTMKDREESAD